MRGQRGAGGDDADQQDRGVLAGGAHEEQRRAQHERQQRAHHEGDAQHHQHRVQRAEQRGLVAVQRAGASAHQRERVEGAQGGQHHRPLRHRAGGARVGHHVAQHGRRGRHRHQRHAFGDVGAHVQPAQQVVDRHRGQHRLQHALQQHHRVVPEPAQRDAPARLEQHDRHAQLQQEQRDAVQRPGRAGKAGEAGDRADDGVAHHLGQAGVPLQQVAGRGGDRQQQRPLHGRQPRGGPDPLSPDGHDLVHG